MVTPIIKVKPFRVTPIKKVKPFFSVYTKRTSMVKRIDVSSTNKRSFTSSIKISSPFIDWPYINDIIKDTRDKELRGEVLWECDYSFVMGALLPYYYHTTANTSWVIVPEFNYLQGNHPDYTIFNISRNPYSAKIHAVVELKSKTGNSWFKILEQMWKQADVAKFSNGTLWAIGQKGLEICIFRFDVLRHQNEDCFTNFEPLNLSRLNETGLNQLGVKFLKTNTGRIGLIKWKLDDDRHKPFIDQMFQYTRSRRP